MKCFRGPGGVSSPNLVPLPPLFLPGTTFIKRLFKKGEVFVVLY